MTQSCEAHSNCHSEFEFLSSGFFRQKMLFAAESVTLNCQSILKGVMLEAATSLFNHTRL